MNSEHLESYIAGELDDAGRRQVEDLLRRDSDLRSSYLHQVQVHRALEALLGQEESADEFDSAVLARLRSEGAEDRGFAKSVLTEIVEEREGLKPLRWPDLVKAGIISAAASIGLMFLLQEIIFRDGLPPMAGRNAEVSGPSYVARLEAKRDLMLSSLSDERVRKDGWLTHGRLEIDSGEALIALNSGATAVVEGPARLSIESNNRIFLETGRLTADVPPAASGFTVNTPRLTAVDIGTRFGVSVGENGDSELHVMEGEVEASRASGNSVAMLLREGLAVRADGRTRNELEPISYAGDNFVMQVGSVATPIPRLRYSFDEAVGAMIEDSGRDRVYDIPLVGSGELDRSPRRAAGRFGGGLVLQPGQSLEVPLSREFRLDAAHTISFWVKIPPKVGRSENEVLLQYGRPETGWRFSCHLQEQRGNRGALRIDFEDGYLIGSSDIADGNWHHVAARFIGGEDSDLATHVHLFVDGFPETISDYESASISEGRVGCLQIGSTLETGLEGWVDEIQLYGEAVPTPFIQTLSEE